jgi:membrane associated rhomboid family serine protease
VERLPRTATNIITALTALAWIIAVLFAWSDQAALRLGFIPGRLSGAEMYIAAAPAWLTPLTATLVHSGLIHLGFNLLVFVWCGTAVERILGRAGLVILYVLGSSAAISAPAAIPPASAISGASPKVSAALRPAFP